MKEKELTIPKNNKIIQSINNRKFIPDKNLDYDEVKRKLNQGNIQVAQPLVKPLKKGPTKTQIKRLKKFYNTTRWLPNSAFTTYFGKPAFENYGYANTNPVYGGLFYGNYMLSHNMNPIDGANHPKEKQVYSSAMMKSLQRKAIRKPSPPRKVPEEIRNTPEELQEIRTRNQIFQLPNKFPSREIIPPNLLKSSYFKSANNTLENSREFEDENEDEYEDWNIQNVINGKKNKKIKINKRVDSKFNPFNQGRVDFKKKKMKEALDNKFSDEFYQNANAKRMKNRGIEYENNEDIEESEGQLLYEKQRNYYLKMLGQDKINQLEDLSKLEVQNKTIEDNNNINNNNYINNNYINNNDINNNDINNNYINNNDINNNDINNKDINNNINNIPPPIRNDHINQEIQNQENENYPMYHKIEFRNPLKKKENPALLPPHYKTLNDKERNYLIYCVNHSQLPINYEEKDPKNYQGMPPCMLSSIIPAGKPTHLAPPLNIFESEYYD